MRLIATEIKNNVLGSMVRILNENRTQLLDANKKDLDAFNIDDQAMYDRLLVNDEKIDGMIEAIMQVRGQEDPINRVITNKMVCK
jgi:glutamate-5-semialdehyde dehydrogenase